MSESWLVAEPHLSDLTDVGAVASQHRPNLSANNGKLDSAGAVWLCNHWGNPWDALAVLRHALGLDDFVWGSVRAVVGGHANSGFMGHATLDRGAPKIIPPCVINQCWCSFHNCTPG